MTNTAKRNITMPQTFEKQESAFISDVSFKEIEEEFSIFLSQSVRLEVKQALSLYALVRDIERSGISVSDLVSELLAHLKNLDAFLEFFVLADRGDNNQRKTRSYLLKYQDKTNSQVPLARLTTAPLKQYRSLLCNVLFELNDKAGIDGRSKNVGFQTLLRLLIPIHNNVMAENNRLRLKKAEFLIFLFSRIAPAYRPKQGFDYTSEDALNKKTQRMSAKIRGQK